MFKMVKSFNIYIEKNNINIKCILKIYIINLSLRFDMPYKKNGSVPTPLERTSYLPTTAIPTEVAYFPEKLQKGINAKLSSECTQEAEALHSHMHAAYDHIVKGKQPYIELSAGDRAVVHTLIKSENARQPELKLTYYSSLSDFAMYLVNNRHRSNEHVRAIVQAGGGWPHHYYVDCYFSSPGCKNSIIFIESYNICSDLNQFHLKRFHLILLSHGLENFRASVINASVQTSPTGCLIYCMAFALKSLYYKNRFLNMHLMNISDNPLSSGFTEIYSYDFTLYPVFSRDILPASFLRHAGSRQVFQKMIDRDSPGNREYHEMRGKLMYQDRSTVKGDKKYLVSIEHKRIQLLRRALIQMGAITLP